MADIQLCTGFSVDDTGIHDCKLRHACKRFTTKGNPIYQAYGPPAQDFSAEHGCKLLWLNEPNN